MGRGGSSAGRAIWERWTLTWNIDIDVAVFLDTSLVVAARPVFSELVRDVASLQPRG
jgi:hypothetical protein